MDSFDDMQQLWQAAVSQPRMSAQDVIRKVKKQRLKMLAGAVFSILALLATVGVMVWVLLNGHPRLLTTRISILVMMTIIIATILFQSRALFPLLGKLHDDASNKTMILSLQRMQERQRVFNKTGISAYFILLSIAMALYLAEFVRGHLLFGLIVYSLTFGWIAFSWFYLRKRGVRKYNARMDAMISRLKEIQQDWEEEKEQSL